MKIDILSENFVETINSISSKKFNYVAAILQSIDIMDKVPFITQHDDLNSIKTIRNLDILQVDEEFFLTYIPANKDISKITTQEELQKATTKGKIGRTIKSLIDSVKPINSTILECEDEEDRIEYTDITDSQLEEFVNLVKSALGFGTYDFKIVSGSDILKYYREDSYQISNKGGSTLFGSCMRHNNCQPFLHFYANNPHCKMLIMMDTCLSTDKIVARALLWEYNGESYIDRRYYSLDQYEVAMVAYIKKMKWNYKSRNTYEKSNDQVFQVFDKNSNSYVLKDNVKLEFDIDFIFKALPYCDTVKYIDVNINKMSNTPINNSGFIAANTGGGYGGTYGNVNVDFNYPIAKCAHCGKIIKKNDRYHRASNSEYFCKECVIDTDILGSTVTKSNLNNFSILRCRKTPAGAIRKIFIANSILENYTSDINKTESTEFDVSIYNLINPITLIDSKYYPAVIEQ